MIRKFSAPGYLNFVKTQILCTCEILKVLDKKYVSFAGFICLIVEILLMPFTCIPVVKIHYFAVKLQEEAFISTVRYLRRK